MYKSLGRLLVRVSTTLLPGLKDSCWPVVLSGHMASATVLRSLEVVDLIHWATLGLHWPTSTLFLSTLLLSSCVAGFVPSSHTVTWKALSAAGKSLKLGVESAVLRFGSVSALTPSTSDPSLGHTCSVFDLRTDCHLFTDLGDSFGAPNLCPSDWGVMYLW